MLPKFPVPGASFTGVTYANKLKTLTSKHGQTHFKNLARNAEKYLECVGPF